MEFYKHRFTLFLDGLTAAKKLLAKELHGYISLKDQVKQLRESLEKVVTEKNSLENYQYKLEEQYKAVIHQVKVFEGEKENRNEETMHHCAEIARLNAELVSVKEVMTETIAEYVLSSQKLSQENDQLRNDKAALETYLQHVISEHNGWVTKYAKLYEEWQKLNH